LLRALFECLLLRELLEEVFRLLWDAPAFTFEEAAFGTGFVVFA
jgi:hypothetical protein